MKIHTDGSRPLTTDNVVTARPAGVAAASETTNASPAVGTVRISEASRALQASGTSNAEAPFDAGRVDAIRAAISAGQFKVDPESIADRMLDSASQLMAGKS